MRAQNVIDLMQKYRQCPKCGNSVINNGKGSLEVTDGEFIRKCMCGWKFHATEDKDGKVTVIFDDMHDGGKK